MKKLGEFELIDKLTRNLPGYGKEVIEGIGDDCAVIKQNANKYLLATCDAQVAGVHFLLDTDPGQIGQKAVAVNISDIAAMGGQPTLCLVSLIIPKSIDTEYIDSVYSGIRLMCERYGIQIIGGNISSGEQLVIDITMMGAVNPKKMLLRSGAKPGDKVLVTGSLGAAAAGVVSKKHILPTPRIKESNAIAKSKLATSMIDISDGLLSDISHICDQSNVGVTLNETQIPVSDSANLLQALSGGEDYELLFTAPSESVEMLIKMISRKTKTPVKVIGEVVPKKEGRWIIDKNGQKRPLISDGWDHFAK